MVDVIDLFQMRIFHHGDLIKARHDLTHRLKGWVQSAKALHICLRPHVFVIVQNRQTILVVDRDNGLIKTTFVPSLFGAALRFHCQCIGFIAGKSVFGGDNVRGNSLGDEIAVYCETRINGERGAVAAHCNATHHFNTSGDIGLTRAAFDLVRGQVHGLHARGAKAVDGKARNALIKIRCKNCRAGKTSSLFHNLGHIAPNNVLDDVTFKVVTFLDCVQSQRRQTQTCYFMQRSVLASFAARRAQGIIDIGFGHV